MRRFEALRGMAGAAIGWTGLLLYLLACRPSWSPDGTRVLFPYYKPDPERVGVAIFDTVARKTVTLYEEEGDGPLQAQWADDGLRVVVFGDFSETADLILVPVDGPGSDEIHRFTLPKEIGPSPGFAAPQVGDGLYFGGDGAVGRLDLKTLDSKVHALEGEGDVLLFDLGEEVAYLRECEGGLELGMLDPRALTAEPYFVVDEGLLTTHHLETAGFLDYEPRARVWALAAVGPAGGKILLYRENRLESILDPRVASPSYQLGDIAWSADGTSLYAVILTPWADATRTELSISEISLEGAVHATRITWLDLPYEVYHPSDSPIGALPMALSPRGDVLAISTAHLEEDVDDEARALYLVDLRDPARPVTKIAAPGSTPLVGE